MIELASTIAARLPPQRPFSAEEKKGMQEPLEECLAKWMTDTGPEMRLVMAVGAVVLMRYVETEIAKVSMAVSPAAPENRPENAPQGGLVIATGAVRV